VDAEADVAHIDTRVRNPSDRPLWLESVVLGFRWSGHAVRTLRFLRHGWQSWSFTGFSDLDATGEPPFPSGAWLRGMYHCQGAPSPERQGHGRRALPGAGPRAASRPGPAGARPPQG